MKKLSCHCGGVEAEVNVPDQYKKLMRCNCSLCKRKGAIMTMVGTNDLKVIKGKDLLKLYQYHTNVAEHYFLKTIFWYFYLSFYSATVTS